MLWFDLIHLYCNLQQREQFNHPCSSDWNSGGRENVEASGVTTLKFIPCLFSNQKSLLQSWTCTTLKVFYSFIWYLNSWKDNWIVVIEQSHVTSGMYLFRISGVIEGKENSKAKLNFFCLNFSCFFFFLNGTLLPYCLHLFFLFTLWTRAVWQLIAASVKYIICQEYIYRKKALMYSVINF